MGRIFLSYYTKPGVLDEHGRPRRFYTEGLTIEWTDTHGRTRHRKGGATAKQAEKALRKAEAEVLDERNSLPTGRRLADMPCEELAEAYLAAQKPHVSAAHLVNVTYRIRAVLAGTKAARLGNLTAERVESFLTVLAEGDPIPATSTINGYLQAVKAMLAWGVARRLLPFNPLAALKPWKVTVRRHARRAVSEDDAARLMAAALAGPTRRRARAYKGGRMPLAVQAECARLGRRNALAYRLMLTAGLRLNEVRELRWVSVDLEAGSLFLCGDKGDKLTGRPTDKEIPLPPETAEALAAWRAETDPADDSAYVLRVPVKLVETLNEDLVAAGLARRIPLDAKGNPVELDAQGRPPDPTQQIARWKTAKADGAGRVLDCHALRHTFGTWLGKRPDVDPKTVQALMRHKNPALTFGVYVHKDRGRMRAAAESMPSLKPRPEAGEEQARKTGTDDAPVVVGTARDCTKAQPAPTSNQQGGEGSGGTSSDVEPYRAAVSHSQPEDPGSNPGGDTNKRCRWRRQRQNAAWQENPSRSPISFNECPSRCSSTIFCSRQRST